MTSHIVLLIALTWLLSGVWVAGYLAGAEERDTGKQEEGRWR